MTYVIAYISTLVVFLAIDMVWVAGLAKNFYKDQLGDLMADPIRIGVAAGFYSVYIVGLVIFAIRPALQSESLGTAAIFGALFGFFCYATYDFTNLATLKGWPVKMVIVDLTWGTFISGLSALAGAWITRLIIA